MIGVLRNPFEFRNATDVLRVGPNDVNRLLLDQILEILAQIDLFSGVDRDRCRLLQVAKELRIRVGSVVAGEDVFDPRDVHRLAGARECDRVFHHPARAAVEREADLVAQHLLHRFDAGDHVLQARARSSDRGSGATLPCAARRTTCSGWRPSSRGCGSRPPS